MCDAGESHQESGVRAGGEKGDGASFFPHLVFVLGPLVKFCFSPIASVRPASRVFHCDAKH